MNLGSSIHASAGIDTATFAFRPCRSTCQRGFTLMELVVAIVIVGVLAAIAMPRMINMGADARIAVLKNAQGAMATAAMVVNAAVRLRGGVADAGVCPGSFLTADNSTSGNGLYCTDEGILVTTNGYPAAYNYGIRNILGAAGLGGGNFNPSTADMAALGWGAAYGCTGSGPTLICGVQLRLLNAPNSGGCYFSYTDAASVDSPPVNSAIVTSGC